MNGVAQLLLPALRWDTAVGWEKERPLIEKGLQLGVGGFILFGGVEDAVRSLTKELPQRSRVPLLIGADLERGAGQQIAGATGLPPLAAIASLGDTDAVRRAARLTAREARTVGVDWSSTERGSGCSSPAHRQRPQPQPQPIRVYGDCAASFG